MSESQTEQELTVEKSQTLAHHIEMMKLYLNVIDLDYAKKVNTQMVIQVGRQESLAVLNPSYNPKKNELIYKQAQSLGYLIKFIETLKECDELKKQVAVYDNQRSEINKMFL